MKTAMRNRLLRRFAYTEGHLAGIRRMIEGHKLCVEIIRQTYAVRRAIQRTEALLLRAHLETCIVPVIRNGREEQSMEELVEVYALHSERRECDGNVTRSA